MCRYFLPAHHLLLAKRRAIARRCSVGEDLLPIRRLDIGFYRASNAGGPFSHFVYLAGNEYMLHNNAGLAEGWQYFYEVGALQGGKEGRRHRRLPCCRC